MKNEVNKMTILAVAIIFLIPYTMLIAYIFKNNEMKWKKNE